MTPPTYATARAACVARYGREPTVEAMRHGIEMADWYVAADDSRGGVTLLFDGDVMMLSMHERYDGAGGGTYLTIVGHPEEWAPLTPLPDALDAADAFLRTHATTATKGP